MAEKRTRKKTTKKTTEKSVEIKKEIETAEPLVSGDVIDTSEVIEEIKNDTVVVCSNFPRDIIYVVLDNNGKEVEILIKGNSGNLRGKAAGILPIGAYGITANVPAGAWEQIKTRYCDDARIKKGLIFASTASKARKEAKERKDLRNGFEPVEPKQVKVKEFEGN